MAVLSIDWGVDRTEVRRNVKCLIVVELAPVAVVVAPLLVAASGVSAHKAWNVGEANGLSELAAGP